MIRELIGHLRKYDEQRKSVEQKFNEIKTNLDKTYVSTSEQYRILLEKATEERDSGVKDLNDGILEMVSSTFKAANTELTEYVSVPIPPEMATIIESAKMMNGDLSNEELQIMRDSVSSNYLANLIMGHLLGGIEKIVRFDEVKSKLDEQQSLILNWINYYNPESYSHAVLLLDENNSLIECDQMITSFLKRKV